MRKIVLVLISPILLVLFLIGLIIYYFTKKQDVIEFVFDVIEHLLDKRA